MDRWVGCPPVGLGLRRAGSKKWQEVGSLLGYSAGEKFFYCMRVGQLSRYSHVLLLPSGVPPMPALACSTQSLGG